MGRHTRGTRPRTNKAESHKDIQDPEAADGSAKGRVKEQPDQRRKVDEKEVLLPEIRPRKIEKQRSHLEANDDQECTQNAIHGREETARIRNSRASASGLLESSNAIRDVAIVDVHRVNLGETFQRCLRLTRGFQGDAQIIPQSENAFRFDAGSMQSALVPDGGNAGLPLLHKREAEKSAALHAVAERLAVIGGLGDFLKF